MIVALTPGALSHNITTPATRVEIPTQLSGLTYIVIVRTVVGFDLLQSETASTLTLTTTSEAITSEFNLVRSL